MSKSASAVHRDRFRSYVGGFVLSLFLTIVPYLLVVNDVASKTVIVTSIVVLALLQLLTQLVFFLHLDREKAPRLNLISFLFAVMVVLILVFGSIWIMNNLNYHGMSAHDLDKYLLEDEGIRR